ncbi:MAG: CRISPR system precrRNA processing endoribonuclease RAMP protein Cas6 [Caldimicrobium sp.]|nr:CRISPR system precrRNA processing endoribonuclease RAMP protein Cas6 [Caldimicrobium sp.]
MLLNIPYKIITFTCKPEDELYLPAFKGSTFRGVLGRALKQALCTLKTQKDCLSCPLLRTCYYAYIFETIPHRERPLPFGYNKIPAVPHPFVLEPPLEEKRHFTTEDTFSLNLILIGQAIQYEPLFLLALNLVASHGIGKGNKKFQILHTSTQTFQLEIHLNSLDTYEKEFSSPGDLTLKLKIITPLRLIFDGRLVRNLEFHHLIRALLRRVSLLYYFHCESSLPNVDAKRWLNLAENIEMIEDQTRWFDWERYSFRKGRRMTLGGLVGEVSFKGKLSPFLSLLRAGEVLHCGKNTSFGLGQFKIVELSPLKRDYSPAKAL